MSRNGTLLPIANGSALELVIKCYAEAWMPGSPKWSNRADWLGGLEAVLHLAFPDSSSADRRLTARHYAPFPLAAGHDVP